MRILHVIHTGRFSGAEILVRDLSLYHSALGHEVAVVSLNPTEESFAPEVVKLQLSKVRWFEPSRPTSRLGRIRQIRSAVTSFRPTHVIAHSVLPSFYARVALFLESSPPIVSVLHDASRNDYKLGTFRHWERLLGFRASAVVAVNPDAIANYKRIVGGHKRFAHIPNGIDVQKIKEAISKRRTLRAALGVTADTVCLQVGRISPVKRQAASIRMLAELKTRGQSAGLKLLFAGIVEDAVYLASLKALVRKHKLQDQVIFLGPRSDVADLLAAADIFLMPSANEAQPIALIEALASGIPLILAAIPEFKWAQAYQAVNTVDTEDAAAFASNFLEIAKSQRVERDLDAYSIANTAQNYLSLLRAVELRPRS